MRFDDVAGTVYQALPFTANKSVLLAPTRRWSTVSLGLANIARRVIRRIHTLVDSTSSDAFTPLLIDSDGVP
jgi:hypothetical protein